MNCLKSDRRNETSPKRQLTTEQLLTALEGSFRDGEAFPLEVTGWSMRPLLRNGRDTVWLQPFCAAQCKRGSILLYQRPNGRLVLHRVRRCLPGGYRMNGDAQTHCEDIAAGQVVAQGFQICRNGKRIACSAPALRLWDALWYPTRPFRPALFGIGHTLKTIFHKE